MEKQGEELGVPQKTKRHRWEDSWSDETGRRSDPTNETSEPALRTPSTGECFNDCGGRGYDDSVPGEVTKTTPSGDKTT